MSTLANPLEQGQFTSITARVLLLFAKIKKRRKDLSDKEKRIGDRIKSLIEHSKGTVLKVDPDGKNGTIFTFTCAPSDSPFAAVMSRYEKKDPVNYQSECMRLYKETYKGDWKKKWKEFTEAVDTSTVDSLDIDVNPNYKIPK